MVESETMHVTVRDSSGKVERVVTSSVGGSSSSTQGGSSGTSGRYGSTVYDSSIPRSQLPRDIAQRFAGQTPTASPTQQTAQTTPTKNVVSPTQNVAVSSEQALQRSWETGVGVMYNTGSPIYAARDIYSPSMYDANGNRVVSYKKGEMIHPGGALTPSTNQTSGSQRTPKSFSESLYNQSTSSKEDNRVWTTTETGERIAIGVKSGLKYPTGQERWITSEGKVIDQPFILQPGKTTYGVFGTSLFASQKEPSTVIASKIFTPVNRVTSVNVPSGINPIVATSPYAQQAMSGVTYSLAGAWDKYIASPISKGIQSTGSFLDKRFASVGFKPSQSSPNQPSTKSNSWQSITYGNTNIPFHNQYQQNPIYKASLQTFGKEYGVGFQGLVVSEAVARKQSQSEVFKWAGTDFNKGVVAGLYAVGTDTFSPGGIVGLGVGYGAFKAIGAVGFRTLYSAGLSTSQIVKIGSAAIIPTGLAVTGLSGISGYQKYKETGNVGVGVGYALPFAALGLYTAKQGYNQYASIKAYEGTNLPNIRATKYTLPGEEPTELRFGNGKVSVGEGGSRTYWYGLEYEKTGVYGKNIIGIGRSGSNEHWDLLLGRSPTVAKAYPINTQAYMPSTAAESQWYLRNLEKFVVRPIQVNGVTIAPSTQIAFERFKWSYLKDFGVKQSSAYTRQSELLSQQTEASSRKAYQNVVKTTKPGDIQFGSTGTKAQLRQDLTRPTHDIEKLFYRTKTEFGANRDMQKILNAYTSAGDKARYVNTEAEPYQIQTFVKGKWDKAFEGKFTFNPDEQIPTATPHGLPASVETGTFRVKPGEFTTLQSESVRKGMATSMHLNPGQDKSFADFLQRVVPTQVASGKLMKTISPSEAKFYLSQAKTLSSAFGLKPVGSSSAFEGRSIIVSSTPPSALPSLGITALTRVKVDLNKPSKSPQVDIDLIVPSMSPTSRSPTRSFMPVSLSPSKSPMSLSPSRSTSQSLSNSLSRSVSPSVSPISYISMSRSPSQSRSPYSYSPSVSKSLYSYSYSTTQFKPANFPTLPFGGMPFKEKKFEKGVKPKWQYKPTMYAASLHITSKSATPKGTKQFGGFELRPITKGLEKSFKPKGLWGSAL